MEIEVQKLSNINKLTVKPEGKINIETADEFKQKIKDNLTDIKELVIDVANVTYISSMGLRILLEFHNLMKEKQGAMYLKNMNSEVKNVIKISGFDSFINVID